MALTTRLQWLVWIGVTLVFFFSVISMDGVGYAITFTPLNIFFYLLIIYGNISLLFPRFWLTGKKVLYVILSVSLLVGVGIARGYIVHRINNYFYPNEHEPFTIYSILYYVLTGFLTFMLSFVFRIAIAYFTLKQQSEKIIAQKSLAELNLLKSQVQPHFLFNTLNNIYYEAYREAPNTAKLIERLSDIMRYFVDESPKDEVSLTTEIQFLENYIALEKIRIRHGIDLNFIKDCNKDLRIPPMLLMTFVENIFKHGIDKSSSENKIELSLLLQDSYLMFQAQNRIPGMPGSAEHRGFGIENLRKRLAFLYGDNFELYTTADNDMFTAFLKVPVSQ